MNPTTAYAPVDLGSLFEQQTASSQQPAQQPAQGRETATPTFWQAVFASWVAPHRDGASVDY